MHPAFSVIFFTTMSGAGYGLLALLGLGGYFQMLPADNALFGGVAIGLALVLVTAGLLSSTFHLGHPERAWRAMSQWRTSWLSREGLCAVLTYLPALAMAWGWVMEKELSGYFGVMGLITAALSLLTIFTTSMIYASLKPIQAWHNGWVPAAYVVLGLMTGLVLLTALMAWFGVWTDSIVLAALFAVVLAAMVKLFYWQSIFNQEPKSTIESATGLGQYGKVSQVQSPHSHENYLLKEMGFQIGRKHARKLRRIAIINAFVLPLLLLLVALVDADFRTLAVSLAVLTMALGVITERWLFFAEAKHTVALYYGR
ncbi:dimethyl sulfoxide reductase anchor subunit [Porticoccaceae bacterium LTM1]|nr:dimethyl sulfoxide reductase anchor subunit [Porticoccaceae bacterium LTM1]